MRRLIAVTGKGGVGKTSIAAAHAIRSADEGQRTLLVSMDMAHNLADLFGTAQAPKPLEVAPNLEILEISPNQVREEDFAHVNRTIAEMFITQPEDEPRTAAPDVPGLDSLFFLLKVHQLSRQDRYDRIICDLAPTGEALSLLQLPELMNWYLEKAFPLGKVAVRVLAPVSQRLWQVSMPDRVFMTDIEKLYGELRAIQDLLRNPELTSVRLVTQPERMILAETRRSYMYLNLFGYHVDRVFVNGIFPPDRVNEFFAAWVALQRECLADIEASFAHLPIVRVPRFPSDLQGLDDIRRLADVAIDANAFDITAGLAHESYEHTDTGYRLLLPVPFGQKDELQLCHHGDDLILRIGGVQRNIQLPNMLHGWEIASARFTDDQLAVNFTDPTGAVQ